MPAKRSSPNRSRNCASRPASRPSGCRAWGSPTAPSRIASDFSQAAYVSSEIASPVRCQVRRRRRTSRARDRPRRRSARPRARAHGRTRPQPPVRSRRRGGSQCRSSPRARLPGYRPARRRAGDRRSTETPGGRTACRRRRADRPAALRPRRRTRRRRRSDRMPPGEMVRRLEHEQPLRRRIDPEGGEELESERPVSQTHDHDVDAFHLETCGSPRKIREAVRLGPAWTRLQQRPLTGP